jgi:5-formyltetrahydrofolate cyclo-ligase
VLQNKGEIRKYVWELMEKRGVAKFPGAFGRIPNFLGCKRAAELLKELEIFKNSSRIKSNPDSPQKPVRRVALSLGKEIYMAVPRLRSEKCFIRLDPRKVGNLEIASTIKGAFKVGKQVFPWEIPPIDLVIVGSVAVNREGARVGKGGGYSDLEYAIGRTFGIIGENTPVVTTVHPLQILDIQIPMEIHDIPVDFIITPDEVIETGSKFKKPERIYWEIMNKSFLEKIPILRRMK